MQKSINYPEPLPDLFYSYLNEIRDATDKQLREKVDSYLKDATSALKQNEFLDIESAKVLVKPSHFLIEILSTLSDEHYKYVVAAIYYFIESDDDEHDFDSIFGFEDDIKVMNYVLNKIGHKDKKIEI